MRLTSRVRNSYGKLVPFQTFSRAVSRAVRSGAWQCRARGWRGARAGQQAGDGRGGRRGALRRHVLGGCYETRHTPTRPPRPTPATPPAHCRSTVGAMLPSTRILPGFAPASRCRSPAILAGRTVTMGWPDPRPLRTVQQHDTTRRPLPANQARDSEDRPAQRRIARRWLTRWTLRPR